MASRGRGRQGSSLTQEQLQALGCIGKEIPAVPTAPPPTFPPLLSKPVPFENTSSQNYQILWKEDFNTFMRNSPYYLSQEISRRDMDRYSDQYVVILENSKGSHKAEIPWHIMPMELRPNCKRLRNQGNKSGKKYKRIESLEDRLKRLEEKEKTEVDVDNAETKAAHSGSESGNEEPEVEDDDEMDEDNDYGNNYFDNGEAFNDEDDNLDDGPIY